MTDKRLLSLLNKVTNLASRSSQSGGLWLEKSEGKPGSDLQLTGMLPHGCLQKTHLYSTCRNFKAGLAISEDMGSVVRLDNVWA